MHLLKINLSENSNTFYDIKIKLNFKFTVVNYLSYEDGMLPD